MNLNVACTTCQRQKGAVRDFSSHSPEEITANDHDLSLTLKGNSIDFIHEGLFIVLVQYHCISEDCCKNPFEAPDV